jgi:hypothetical protein
LFDIQITPNTSDDNVLSARFTFTYIDTVRELSRPVTFHAALIETDLPAEEGGYVNQNVVRKLLLGVNGIPGITESNRTWRLNDDFVKDIDYQIDVPIVDSTKLKIVAFVQDKANGMIYQARIIDGPIKVGIDPVGIVDNPLTAEIDGINVYPNPASKTVNFSMDKILSRDYAYEVIDQRGISILKGDVKRDLTIPQRIAINDLANGVYIIKFAQAGKAITYRKIVVLNRH